MGAIRPGGGGSVTPDALAAVLGQMLSEDPAGAAIIGDGAGNVGGTSADVSAFLAASTKAAARTALLAGSYSSGVDSARPAASTSLIGTVFSATDTATSYYCESDGSGGARWRNVHSGLLDNSRVSILTTNDQLVGATNRSQRATQTWVLFFGGSALPGSLAQMAGNFSGGAQLEIGFQSGDRGLLTLYRAGVTSARNDLTGATLTGALNTMHAIAISMTATTIRWSFDGGTVAGTTITGTPSGTGPWYVGGNGTPYTSGFHTAFRVLAEAASDGDLVLLTNSTARTAYRIPAVASATTVVLDWHVSRAPRGTLAGLAVGSEGEELRSVAAPRVTAW